MDRIELAVAEVAGADGGADRIELATHLCHVSDRLIDARRSLLGSAGVEQSDVKASDQVRTCIELLKAIHETIATLTGQSDQSRER